MKHISEPVERAIVLCLAIVLVVIIDLFKPAPAPSHKIDIRVTILSAEKRQDQSIDVTAEIANNSSVTLADNRLFIVPEASGGTYHTSEDGSTGGSGTGAADDPRKDTPARELEGSFDPIPPDAAVKIAFTVPSETAVQEPLYVIFQSTKLRYENTEETRVITVTEPLQISD